MAELRIPWAYRTSEQNAHRSPVELGAYRHLGTRLAPEAIGHALCSVTWANVVLLATDEYAPRDSNPEPND